MTSICRSVSRSKAVVRVPLPLSRRVRQLSGARLETDEWFAFPRESPGNTYSVNWSLVDSGVIPVGNCFHNLKTDSLLKYITQASKKDPYDLSSVRVDQVGRYVEAGDSITHQEFASLLSNCQGALSSGADLFVEDGATGSHPSFRLGVRVVTDRPSLALALRYMMFPARINTARPATSTWDGTQYVTNPEKDARPPIVVLIGSDSETVATQFLEQDGLIKGNGYPLQRICFERRFPYSFIVTLFL